MTTGMTHRNRRPGRGGVGSSATGVTKVLSGPGTKLVLGAPPLGGARVGLLHMARHAMIHPR